MADSTLIHGRYQLQEQIGRGGMGQVWRARDEALGRKVAVKCLKPLGGQEDESAVRALRERFRREARVAAGLQHRGITVVHDFGESDGVLYLVMELLEGRNLSQLLSARKAAPLPEPEVADIADQIGAALAYTHDQGIIHRDLKPANLMLLTDGTVKICDFGIARLAHDIGLSAKLTTAGMAMGTPHYMSPEQISGSPVDFRSDLYSLGCVLYELATGAPPFDLGDPWAILIGHRDRPPESLRAHRPELSAALDDLVLSLLAKDPDDRPGEVATAARQLSQRLSGEAGAPQPPSPHAAPALPAWSRGMRPGLRARGTRSLVRPVLDPTISLTQHWTGLGPAEAPVSHPGAAHAPRLAPAPSVPELMPPPATAPAARAGLPALPRPRLSDALLAALASRHSVGVHLARLGRWAEALEVHQGLLAEREQALGAEHPDTLESRHEVSVVLARLHRWEEALNGYGGVADARARMLGRQHPDTLAARYEVAISLAKLGRPAEALEIYRELVAARTHSMGRSHPETLRARHGLGVNLGRLGRWEEALAEARDVLALRTGVLGGDHPQVTVSRRETAIALSWLGRWEEALTEYGQVLAAQEQQLGPGHPEVTSTQLQLAHCLEQLGHTAEAAELQRRAEQR